MEDLIQAIKNCDLCYGRGYVGFTNGEDWDIEDCECNPHGIILDEDGSVIHMDNEIDYLFTTAEAN